MEMLTVKEIVRLSISELISKCTSSPSIYYRPWVVIDMQAGAGHKKQINKKCYKFQGIAVEGLSIKPL